MPFHDAKCHFRINSSKNIDNKKKGKSFLEEQWFPATDTTGHWVGNTDKDFKLNQMPLPMHPPVVHFAYDKQNHLTKFPLLKKQYHFFLTLSYKLARSDNVSW